MPDRSRTAPILQAPQGVLTASPFNKLAEIAARFLQSNRQESAGNFDVASLLLKTATIRHVCKQYKLRLKCLFKTYYDKQSISDTTK